MAETGILRQPTAFVNGIPAIEVEVSQIGSQGGGTSTFEAHLALDGPLCPPVSFWASASQIPAQVMVNNGDGSGSNIIFDGFVDHVSIDFGIRVVSVHGRGKDGQLADTRNDQNYANQPVQSIIQQVAGKAGLGAVITAPNASAMAGHTYEHQNYNFITDKMNNWDTIQQLAEQAGGRAFVHLGSLYVLAPGTAPGGVYLVNYVPPTWAADGINSGPLSYDDSNSMKITCSRDTQAGNTPTTVASQMPYDKQTNTAGDDSGAGGGQGGGASVPGAGSPL